MSFVIVVPDVLAAASDLRSIGSALDEAHAAAVATTSLLPAGADEVLAALAALFSGHGQTYQTISAQAAAFHAEFVQALHAGGGAYASAEAANTSPLASLEQEALGVIRTPPRRWWSCPLIGNGTNGAPGRPAGRAGCCMATAATAAMACPVKRAAVGVARD